AGDAPAARPGPADDGERIRLGPAGGEDDLAGRAADEGRDLLARALQERPGGPSVRVHRRGIADDFHRLHRRRARDGMEGGRGGPVQIGARHRSEEGGGYSSRGTGRSSSTPHSARKRSRTASLRRSISASLRPTMGIRPPAIWPWPPALPSKDSTTSRIS